jgi:uncharacterized membrane protein YbhN (UPF0104 family)
LGSAFAGLGSRRGSRQRDTHAGGIGVVGAVLIAALVASGLAVPAATAAVIFYRIITFKLLITLVWVMYGSKQRQQPTVPGLTQTPS